MDFLTHLGIKTKLFIGFVGVALFVGVVGVISFYNQNAVKVYFEGVVNYTNPKISSLQKIQQFSANIVSDAVSFDVITAATQNSATSSAALKEISALVTNESSTREEINEFTTLALGDPTDAPFAENMFREEFALFAAANTFVDINKTNASGTLTFVALQTLTDEEDRFSQVIMVAIDHENDQLDAQRANTGAAVSQTQWLSVWLFAGAALLAILIGSILARSLSGSLEDMRISAEEIANGDFDKRIKINSRDEIGRLGNTLNTMAEKLKESNTRIEGERDNLKRLLESIGDGVITIDRSWNITLINPIASSMTGWSAAEVLGKPFRNFIKFVRESDKAENITFIEETMLFGRTHTMKNHTFLITKDNREISVGDSSAPILEPNGTVAGAIVVFRDVSKERDLEKAREEIASLITHELRAPLAAIKGFSDLLLGGAVGALSEEQKKSIDSIHGAVERMLALVSGLLNSSRIELGTLAVQPEPLYVPDIAEKTFVELNPQIEQKNLKITKQYDEKFPSINLDPMLMHAIFQNLLSNAISYTPPGGSVKLTIETKEPNFLIKVSDTGYGIPKDQQSKIFTKLFRADNVRVAHIAGTGLGLYMVKLIVEQSKGTIWFESEENKGSTFFVSLPLEGMKQQAGTKGLS